MIFALLKISGSRTGSHSYTYSSTLMETGASDKWNKAFESESSMIASINAILARQKRRLDVRYALNKIRDGEFYFFDLDLTPEEAASLGWMASSQHLTAIRQ